MSLFEEKKIENPNKSGYYYIKPAANHILTVGKGIIKDSYTAILELVKNSYDADAENVNITIKIDKSIKITIEDDGHGMDYETVTEKWMVPSTQNKLRQRTSKFKSRKLQGRKGIGRYASTILGNDLLMRTTDTITKETTTLYLNWEDFESDEKFLEDVEILIESYNSDINSGTYIDITGFDIWEDNELENLITVLRRLLSPFNEVDEDRFNINIKIQKEGSNKYSDFEEDIKPLPVLEYYHYRISGDIKYSHTDDGIDYLNANLIIENKNLKNILPIHLQKTFLIENPDKFNSDIKVDIRAFDLDEIVNIEGLTEVESKKQLNEIPGIAIIKDGFRVRPYGDKKTDWLGLNERRYNNPTFRLSNNQVSGYITVQQEEESKLEERATREGFKENEYYNGLKKLILMSLSELEPIRYRYRKQFKKGGRKSVTIGEQLNNVLNFESLNNKIYELFKESNIEEETFNKVKIILEAEEKIKNEQINEIKDTIAKYQGQVTLGKILTVVFHEARKPLNVLKQHPSIISSWSKVIEKLIVEENIVAESKLKEYLVKIIDRLDDSKRQSELINNIFKKIEPLANARRAKPSKFNLVEPINNAFKLFQHELEEKSINVKIEGDVQTTFEGLEVDLQISFANLIENSIYWMQNSVDKLIRINIIDEEDKIIIEYSDTGAGIDITNIEQQDIFDPGFTTKEKGTGLGLSITGEALERNKGKIQAISNDQGAFFIINLNK